MIKNEILQKAVTDLQMMERMKGIGHPDTIANRAIVSALEKTFSDSARAAAAAARKAKGGGGSGGPGAGDYLKDQDRQRTEGTTGEKIESDLPPPERKSGRVDKVKEAHDRMSALEKVRDSLTREKGADHPDTKAAQAAYVKATDEYDHHTYRSSRVEN